MTCCSDSETGLAVGVSIKAPNAGFASAITGTGTTRTLTITTDASGFFKYQIWLIDLATAPGTVTLVPTTGDATTFWEKVTNSVGVLTLTVTNTTVRTWYFAIVLLGKVSVSDAVAFT